MPAASFDPERAAFRTWPRELRITLERGVPAAPTGPGLVGWKEGPPAG